ncbi:hypothetical protein [Myxosarcina sp. GI1(2024)]
MQQPTNSMGANGGLPLLHLWKTQHRCDWRLRRNKNGDGYYRRSSYEAIAIVRDDKIIMAIHP